MALVWGNFRELRPRNISIKDAAANRVILAVRKGWGTTMSLNNEPNKRQMLGLGCTANQFRSERDD